MKRLMSSLALLMFRVLADDTKDTFAFYNLALVTDLSNRTLDLHQIPSSRLSNRVSAPGSNPETGI
jgi:hypothetical protein